MLTGSRLLAANYYVELPSPRPSSPHYHQKETDNPAEQQASEMSELFMEEGLELPIGMKICPTSLITEMQVKALMFPTHQIGNIFKSLRIPNGEQIWQNRYSYILLKGVQIGTQTGESKLAISSRIDTVEVPDGPAISFTGLVM